MKPENEKLSTDVGVQTLTGERSKDFVHYIGENERHVISDSALDSLLDAARAAPWSRSRLMEPNGGPITFTTEGVNPDVLKPAREELYPNVSGPLWDVYVGPGDPVRARMSQADYIRLCDALGDAARYLAALRDARDFIEEEGDNRRAAGSEHSDYEREPRDLLERVDAALSGEEQPVPADVAALVLAARAIMDDGGVGPSEEEKALTAALDKALEAFASLVPYANGPAPAPRMVSLNGLQISEVLLDDPQALAAMITAHARRRLAE